ncbi:BQ2448_6897 [Microbotryum intermedium]|uniref:BQ2448_6897 protein n=1 Tax=Microbotryum intermedium TaxID=269621 RepID=A0A238FGN2_9BASI|nr:BQ2448_6897 [Microbotryum intermedium]
MLPRAVRPFVPSWSAMLCVLGGGLSLVFAAAVPKCQDTLPIPHLDSHTLSKVIEKLDSVARDVWVSGTQTEAYLEFDHPQLTVFDPNVFPLPNASSTKVSREAYPSSSNRIVLEWLKKLQPGDEQFAVIEGGAAGDPASLGYAWIVAELTARHRRTKGRLDAALQAEVNYLLTQVPRTEDGAMSHRSEEVQLWSDFVYMVPPFLVARGIVTKNKSLVLESYNQIKLYRSHLQDPQTRLWKHVLLGHWEDTSLWATGNAWVVAGITRVLATLMHSHHAQLYKDEIRDLTCWANEIVDAAFARVNDEGLLPNHLNDPIDFSDSSSSALLAATVFRLDQLGILPQNATTLNTAETLRSKVYKKIDKKTGWLSGCVDPLNWYQQIDHSPEGQAFVVLLQAASRDHRVFRKTLLRRLHRRPTSSSRSKQGKEQLHSSGGNHEVQPSVQQ